MRWEGNAGTALVLVALLLVLGVPQAARADGTGAGTDVDNTATVGYDISGVPQTPIESSPTGNSTPGVGNGTPTSFVVDQKIDLTVAPVDGAAVAVVPGADDQVLTFTVTNDGNEVQDFSLAAAAATGTWGGATDNFDANNVEVYVDANGNGVYEPGTDTATYIDELAVDASVTVFIVADIPLGQTDGDGALYDLVAQVAEGGAPASQGADILSDDSGIADDPATVQIVFADAAGTADNANDGQHSSTDAYIVVSASLEVSKTSAVISDPVNGAVNPKAIPGATVRYTITVTNNGGDDADNVEMVDDIPANTTFVAGTLYLGAVQLTDGTAGDDEGDYNLTNVGAVTVAVVTVAQGGGSITVTFDVTID